MNSHNRSLSELADISALRAAMAVRHDCRADLNPPKFNGFFCKVADVVYVDCSGPRWSPKGLYEEALNLAHETVCVKDLRARSQPDPASKGLFIIDLAEIGTSHVGPPRQVCPATTAVIVEIA